MFVSDVLLIPNPNENKKSHPRNDMAQVRLKDLSASSTKNLKKNDSTRPNARNCQISRATPQMRELAKRLIKLEAKVIESRQPSRDAGRGSRAGTESEKVKKFQWVRT